MKAYVLTITVNYEIEVSGVFKKLEQAIDSAKSFGERGIPAQVEEFSFGGSTGGTLRYSCGSNGYGRFMETRY